jgi:energy-coupling factor transporter ATP-binding protein EcfA2
MTAGGQKLIEVRDLAHRYPGGAPALQGIDLDVHAGEFVAIVGQNGAGKTTLTKHFNALLRPTRGDVWVRGVNTRRARTAKLARHVGYVFQNPDHQIFSETVWEEVAFGPARLGARDAALEEAVAGALAAVELLPYKDRHPYTLSKGDRQRVALASVLAMPSEILVIDEPTTGQDYRQARQIMEVLRLQHEAGRTLLVVTHDMTIVAEYTRRTVLMGRGRILADGPTRDVLARFDLLRQTNLRPPQITLLGAELGTPSTALRVSDVRAFILAELRAAGSPVVGLAADPGIGRDRTPGRR